MADLFDGLGPDPYHFSLDMLVAYRDAGLLLVEAEPSQAMIAKGLAAGAPSAQDAMAIYKAMTRAGARTKTGH